MEQKLSYIEVKAQDADQFPRYRSIKISYIREKVSEMLTFIGTSGFFEEYTRHDITHIDAMLNLACDIIPDSTKTIMTPIEWLLLTFAIYFHDMGMIVTRDEYKNRGKSSFASYKTKVESGEYGKDFAAKVKTLEEPEKFLYQEFVREHHAERVADWVNGRKSPSWGACDAAYDEVQKILTGLNELFRNDLATICLSHHKDDLYDIEKYKLDEILDNSKNAKANLQYISIILRTADLLHITSNRTPSIAYHLINPNDPKSIIEWEKQSAVIAVIPTSSKDNCESETDDFENDAFSVTAHFSSEKSPEAYFGLIAYLNYAEKQLIADGRIVATSENKAAGKGYSFPWKKIEDKRIETPGFEKKQFQFDLDQRAILNLLVGHTLYNDSSVVLREVIQNSIDAVKCQKLLCQTGETKTFEGIVKVEWDSRRRILSFIDNGTGMSMYDVEHYLFRVGASKYRTSEFTQKHPDFSAISRFGIGILTCFLIADDLDIITNAESEEALHIAIRNVHGKYLIKHLNKDNLRSEIKAHGTIVQLYLHEDIDMVDIEKNIKKWIVIPEIRVLLSIDNQQEIEIGYKSTKDALEHFLGAQNCKYNIVEEKVDGVSLAFATTYDRYFDDQTIAQLDNKLGKDDADDPIGVCIEGIRVEMNTPGYTSKCLISCCNVTGGVYAQTNVARSAIEMNEGKKRLLKAIYSLYLRNISVQFKDKLTNYKCLSRASEETHSLLLPYYSQTYYSDAPKKLEDKIEFKEEFNKLPLLILEENAIRKAASPNDILALNEVTIVQNRILDSAETLLGATQTEKSIVEVLDFLGLKLFEGVSSGDHLLCNYNNRSLLYRNSVENKEVMSISVDITKKSVVLKLGSNVGRWKGIDVLKAYEWRSGIDKIYLPIAEFDFPGLINEIGVVTPLGLFMKPGNPISDYLFELSTMFDVDAHDKPSTRGAVFSFVITFFSYVNSATQDKGDNRMESIYRQISESSEMRMISVDRYIEKKRLFDLANLGLWDLYDQNKWTRATWW